MFKVAVAHSLELDSGEAVKEVLEQCREQLGELKPQAGLLFAGIDHDHALILQKIETFYPDIELIGCTTDGEISSVHGFADDSITLMAFCSDEVVFKAGVADNVFQDSARVIREALESVISILGHEPVLCITTPSAYSPTSFANGDELIHNLRSCLGDTFPVFGGTAADQWRIHRCYQFCNGSVFTFALPFLLIGGPVLHSFGADSGWIPIGPKETVTESKGNVVYRIGDETAIEFYRHYLGDSVVSEVDRIIGEYPLAVFEENDRSFRMRGGGKPIQESGALIFAGNLPEGAMVQISHAGSRDEIVRATANAIRASIEEYPGKEPLAAICFPGASRKQLLGTRIEEEYLLFKNNYPHIPVIGFYTYGEFAPSSKNQKAQFHNQLFVNLVLGVK